MSMTQLSSALKEKSQLYL